jgi:hypothetical protein
MRSIDRSRKSIRVIGTTSSEFVGFSEISTLRSFGGYCQLINKPTIGDIRHAAGRICGLAIFVALNLGFRFVYLCLDTQQLRSTCPYRKYHPAFKYSHLELRLKVRRVRKEVCTVIATVPAERFQYSSAQLPRPRSSHPSGPGSDVVPRRPLRQLHYQTGRRHPA